jgi:hypothetical protein
VEEEGFELEILQRDGVRHVEFPSTRWHNSKTWEPSQREERKRWDE